MSSLKTYKFDPSLKGTPQNVIGGHIITELTSLSRYEWDICPYTLSTQLSILNKRFIRTIMEIIIEFDIVNPQITKVMGGNNLPPYNGVYNPINNEVVFDLSQFPDNLVIILYKFCSLDTSRDVDMVQRNSMIAFKMSNNNTQFVLKDCIPSEYYARLTPITTKVSSKSDTSIVNPGKVHSVGLSGGNSRIVERGVLLDRNRNIYKSNDGTPCWWHRHNFDGPSIGVPIYIQRLIDGTFIIHMDGVFCSAQCAYAYIIEEQSKRRCDPAYINSKTILLQLWDEFNPGVKLHPAPDWRLLRDVGNGPLNPREFKEKLSGYSIVMKPNCYFVPIGRSYELTNY